jgi:hypothetical protein
VNAAHITKAIRRVDLDIKERISCGGTFLRCITIMVERNKGKIAVGTVGHVKHADLPMAADETKHG